MDPLIWTALISAAGAVTVAYISRPTVSTHRRLKRTEAAVDEVRGEFRNNGGSTAKDQLDRIERGMGHLQREVAHLRGRFDQHLQDSPKG